MQTTSEQVIFVIIAVIAILLFLGIMFLVTLVYHSNRRKQLKKQQQELVVEFEKQILQSKLEMQEQTFNFISGEIHDNVGQVLSLAKVQLNILEESGSFNKILIQQTKDSVAKAMMELRDIAKSLSTERIQAFDLISNVEEEVYRINKSGFVKAVVSKTGEMNVKDEHKLILFRVIQECIQNIVKHAKASNIIIETFGGPGKYSVKITDDGIGFNQNLAIKAGSGLGLSHIKQRLQLIGGEYEISSQEGRGTVVQIKFNY